MKTTYKITYISLVLLASLLSTGCQPKEAATQPEEFSAPTQVSTVAIQPTETVIKSSPTATKRQPTQKPTLKPTTQSTQIDGSVTPTTKTTGTTAATPAAKTTGTAAATATVKASPTPTEVKIADFSSAKFFTGGALPDWQYFIALEFDGNLTGEYFALVDKNKEYSCEILSIYPNRLYCDGPQAAFMDFVNFEVFDAKTKESVYQERIWIPGTYYVEKTTTN